MAGNVVCQGALCSCNQGSVSTPLTVTSQQVFSIGGMLVATIMDSAPMVNVAPFGICQQLTKMAGAVPTPCVPAPTGAWTPGAHIAKATLPVLTKDSKLTCGVGGQISISDPNCLVDYQVE
jgi:hypothetical protein